MPPHASTCLHMPVPLTLFLPPPAFAVSRPLVFKRIMECLVIMSVATSFVFIVKAAFVQAVLVLVLAPLIVYRYSSFCYDRCGWGSRM
eukprot:146483-Chlamydomonas_euryale.AAC.2